VTLVGTAESVSALLRTLTPFDAVEADHQAKTLAWLRATDDVFRRAKPATPAPHLVSYFVLLDRAQRRLLLVEHRLAGLWLPPGGHVEPSEHPVATVLREATEELRLAAELLHPQPFFLTWTPTVGEDSHIDVSLWFLLEGDADRDLAWDRREFASVQWWSPEEILAAPSNQFDPHLPRFLSKLAVTGVW